MATDPPRPLPAGESLSPLSGGFVFGYVELTTRGRGPSRRTLLSLSGRCASRTITALMGASGAGKTLLVRRG